MSARLKRAQEAWGDVPAYIQALVDACDGSSQNKVAAQLGYSGAVISQVITKTYPGDMGRVEAQIRMVLMRSKIICPALGEIQELGCHAWQKEAKVLCSSSPTKVRMFHACRGCARFKKGDVK